MKILMLPKLRFSTFVLAVIFAVIYVGPAQEKPITLLKITELKSGLKLRYTLSLPRYFSQTEAYPLVVALHYGGKITPFFSKEFVTSFLEPALEDLGAIIVAPDCPSKGWTNAVSESAILELMLLLMEEYNIESDRIIITGYSMGGEGTWYLAARHPELFSAAIPISAPADYETMPIIEDVSVYIIHGEKDELFPSLDVKLLYYKQKNNGAEIEMNIVAGVSHYQMNRFIYPLKATIPWLRNIWENR